MPKTNSITKQFSESIIRRMTRISNEYNAVNLSQGFPDFPPPREIIEAAHHAMEYGPHQYAVTWGDANFRHALAKKQQHFMGIPINADENIVVTCGSTEAMLASLLAICEPGDKVIVFSPFYENYAADTILSRAEPIFVSLHPPTFNFNKSELEAAFLQSPKAIILCNPANPSGKVFSLDELNFIAHLAAKHDTYVITDEVYEHIVYPPEKHHYFAAIPDMFERTISCSSLSKTYSITGWRLGYVIAPKEIINEIKKVHDFLTVGAAAPLQAAAVTGLSFPESYYDKLTDEYNEKRLRFLHWLDAAGLTYYPPSGAYYVLVDISEFIDATYQESDALDDHYFCEWLIKRIGVAAVPGSSFFKNPVKNYIRFHFAKQLSTLDEAGEKLLALRQRWNEDHHRSESTTSSHN